MHLFSAVCIHIAGFKYDLFVGVAANGLSLALVLLIRVASKRWNRKCAQFFGVQKRRQLNVYYGCISVGTGLVGARESHEVIRFAELFRLGIGGRGDSDSLLKRVFLATVRVCGIPSCPGTEVSLENSLITLGSPKFSLASAVFERELEPKISVHNGGIAFPGGKVEGDDSQAVLVKKCRDGLAYFYVAGIEESGTVAASRYLAEHWKELARKYPAEQSFFVRLHVGVNPDQAHLGAEGALE